MARQLLSILCEEPISPRMGGDPIGLTPMPTDYIKDFIKRITAMLQPLSVISKQALLGVLFLFGMMLLCAALLSPVAMCALVNFGY